MHEEQKAAHAMAAHRQVLAQLHDREAQLRLLTDHLPAAISYVDKSERYRFNNRTYEEWFGRKQEQIYGRTVREILGEEAYALIRDKVQAALSGRAVTFEASIPDVRSGARYVCANFVPHRGDDGEVKGFYALVSDISSTKQAELAERRHMQELAHAARLASLGEMAAELSHELTQPLSAIAGYSRSCTLLLERGDIEKVRDIAIKLRAQAELAAEIVRSLRRFIQRGTPEQHRIDLRAVVRDAMRLIQWDADARRVPLRLETPEVLPPAYGDRTLIEQVVLNLLRNALDAVNGQPAGDNAIRVATVPRRDAVEISVTDYGSGFTPEAKERLFEPFFTTKQNGVGIGLVICRRIVESHGGRLWAEDGPDGRGARFTFTIPLDAGTG